ncbi:MAG: metallophosphoesterase [Candidatus Bathyarchaeota archaeon]|nr:MAG: metallophosphoesterase [Candidatus Bathyarchaeota archaeon]
MVNFLHISDIHIPDKKGDLWFGVDPCKKLEKLIELAKKLELNPSFTVITGDISHTGTIQSYNLAKKYIDEFRSLGGPVYPTMGTHDNRRNFSNILLGRPSPREEPPCHYSRTIEGLHVITMDSHTPGSLTGSFGEAQLDWLEKELREHQDEPAIIAFHEPIFFFGELGMFDKADAIRFKETVSRGNVLAVLSGHIHCPLFTMVDEVHYVQAGSPLWENSFNERGTLTHDSSSFNLLSYNEDPDGRPLHLPHCLLVKPVAFSEGTKLIEKKP